MIADLTKGINNEIVLQPIYRKYNAPAKIVKELFYDFNLENYREAVSFNI
jgi:hypothetical protein